MPNDLITKTESLLFITNKPLSYKKLADLSDSKISDIKEAAEQLKVKYNDNDSGVKLLDNGRSLQLATAPESAQVVEEFLKQELTGEMTKPQLEALTIVAYRGPILKLELEQIRGVNCSLILRNLLMRGLVESTTDSKDKQPRYLVTMDFLRFLGVSKLDELPDYEKLSHHENIEVLLEQQNSNEYA
jgi:segregation and condensation protein B